MIQKIDRPKKVKILTWGCQMNVADSGHMAGILQQDGYEITQNEAAADVVLLNTCSIRELAEDKVFSKLGELRERKEKEPNLVVGVCGCMATNIKEGIFKRAPHVDLLCGPRSSKHLPRMLSDLFEKGKAQVEIEPNEALEDFLPSVRESHFKAWVNITQGCDERCTYCVVPNTRGDQASRQPESILNEVRELAKNGYKEITLLGQTVNAYGLDLPRPIAFSDLIAQIHAIDGIEWIRFVTSHPKYVTPDFIEMFAKYPKVAPFLHLPFQAGSNRILKRMARRYTIEEYLEKIEALKKVRPDLNLSTDIIVGFPEETEEEFEATLETYRKAQFDSSFCFKYSERPNTPAAHFKDSVADEVKKERLNRLFDLQKEIAYFRNLQNLGKVHRVLFESVGKKEGRILGHNQYNQVVIASGGPEFIGQFREVLIVETGPMTLYGEIKN